MSYSYKIGDRVRPIDGSWTFTYVNGEYVYGWNRYMTDRNWKVIKINLNYPAMEYNGFKEIIFNGVKWINDICIQAEDSGEVLFINSKNIKLIDRRSNCMLPAIVSAPSIQLMDGNGNILTQGGLDFNIEYEYTFIGKPNLNNKENKNMDTKLMKLKQFLKNEVDEKGNFEMYVVVDADDKDHEAGVIFKDKEVESYTRDQAFEDLKETNLKRVAFPSCVVDEYAFNSLYLSPPNNIKKQTSIREELLEMKDKMFKVLVNKEDVVNIINDVVYIDKYKVLEEVELNPVLKIKVKKIKGCDVDVIIYNSITEKSKAITVQCYNEDINELKEVVRGYLDQNEREVKLLNSTLEEGVEL